MLKAIDWNYSLKCRGLIKRIFRPVLLKVEDFCLPKHRTNSPPMEGPHTNVGTWAPSYLATLLMIPHLNIYTGCYFEVLFSTGNCLLGLRKHNNAVDFITYLLSRLHYGIDSEFYFYASMGGH